jgi:sugar lactone lactonase YvrE
MNKLSAALRIQVLIIFFLSACNPATELENTPTPQTDFATPALIADTPIPSVPASEPASTPTPIELAVTQVKIDGVPTDWGGYEAILNDPEGDNESGHFDIANVHAFTNDQFLYGAIETYGPRGDYAQLDLIILANNRSFVISFRPEEGGTAVMGEETASGFERIGDVPGSDCAADEIIEFKIPLSAFDALSDLTLRNIRPMTGKCCDESWRAIDEIKSVRIIQVNEVEHASGADAIPEICSAKIAPPMPIGAFDPAPVQFSQQGLSAEWFVPPSAFNMPQEVFLTPEGRLLVLAIRNFALFNVSTSGTVDKFADVNGMAGDIDAKGNVYIHSASDGTITQIAPDGATSILVRSKDLETSCDSGFGFGPDGNLYLTRNLCDFGEIEKADLYRISTTGQITRVSQGIPAILAIRTAPDGRFLAGAQGGEIYELTPEDYSLVQLGSIPGGEGVARSGLAVDASGNIYVSTGTRSLSGQIFRLDTQGEVSLLAEIPGNGLSGIEWMPDTGEIIGTQLQLGTLIGVAADGSFREIVPGNGLITPRGMAFSPCGELAVSNEDGGLMTLVNPAGEISRYFEYNSFTSPVSFMVFDPEGALYVTEGAPGLPERVVSVLPGKAWPEPFVDAARPGGIARRADGTLIVAETIANRILQVNTDGSTEIFVSGITRPTSLAMDSDNNLYVVTGTGGRPLDEYHMPDAGDTILRYTSSGEKTTLARWTRLAGLALAPSGELYAATGWDGGIVSITEEGEVYPFASGLQEVTDLAFDLAGNLYISDTVLNGIVRIGGFPHGMIGGVITDDSGVPVENARVQILSDWPIVVGQVVIADTGGHFSLDAAPRTYVITVTAEGYEEKALREVKVEVDKETVVEIVLSR